MADRPQSSKVDSGYIHINGESHVLNYDTNILNLEKNKDISFIADDAGDTFIPATSESMEEEGAVELSPGGILDEETIERGLSNLGRNATGDKQVYLHCTVAGFNLKDISILANYTELQKVEIPYNQLTDLSPLSHLPYLLILDASHNKLTTMLNFTPPKNLKDVDLSFNDLKVMTDLSAHHYLAKLVLDNNHIKDIDGLQNCKRLKYLSMAHNKVERIQGLDNLQIQYLNLCHNRLMRIENLESLKLLQQINVSGNKIRSLKGLQDHQLLENIDLEDNEVIDITETKYIKDLQMLRQLNLLRNPIQELPDYRLSILYQIQILTELDRHKVEVDEKVAAVNMFNPPPEVIAARDHIMHVVYSFLQPSRVWDSTLPSIETPYPMLVLVGPQGSGKKDLAMKLVEEFNDYFGYGISHTTRKPHKEETAGKDYHFVADEKFELDIKMGQFIQTYQYNGQWYGLQMESIESVAREGLACVVHMELEGVLTLKNTYFEPRYVLVMPLSDDAHEKRLQNRGIYTEKQIEYTLARGEIYKSYNQNHPGFFDMMINSDDIQEAYKRLRRLVMDYLGIGLPALSANENAESAGDGQRGETEHTQLLTRTWSKPSLSENSLTYTRARAMQSPIASARGIVEEASLKRRQSIAKDTVTGAAPPLFQQLLTSYPKTAPQCVIGQDGLGQNDNSAPDEQRSYSAPVVDLIKPERPGSYDSSDRSGANSSLTGLTSASDRERRSSPDALTQAKEPKQPSNPHPGSLESRNKPGSDKYKVLPSISPNHRRPVELVAQ